MSGVITSSSFSKLLWPGLNAIYGKAYNDYPVKSSDKPQKKLTKILNKLISLEDELEKLTKNYTWQELANIPRLKAKACIMYRKENNCGLCDAYKAINEYVDNLNNSRT